MNKIPALTMVLMLLLSSSPFLVQKSASQTARPTDSGTARIINESEYVWYGDLIVNENDTFLIENCNFTLMGGSIYVYGILTISNSTLQIRDQTSTYKEIYVCGYLNISCSNVLDPGDIWLGQPGASDYANVSLYNSSLPMWSIIQGRTNSTWVDVSHSTINEWDEVPGDISGFFHFDDSEVAVMSLELVDFQDTQVDTEIVGSKIGVLGLSWSSSEVYIQGLGRHVNDFTFYGENNNVSVTDCCVNSYTVEISCLENQIVQSARISDSNLSIELVLSTERTDILNLVLVPGYFFNKTILIEGLIDIKLQNSTVNTWYCYIMKGQFSFTDSDCGLWLVWWASLKVANSTISNLTLDHTFRGNLTMTDSTVNTVQIWYARDFINATDGFTLNQGVQDSITLYNATRPCNVTMLRTTVNSWWIDSQISVLNIYNSTMPKAQALYAPMPDLPGEVISSFNSSVNVYNSNVDAGAALDNSSLTIVNSTFNTVYAYGDSNVTLVNSTVGILIRDPPLVNLSNSTLYADVLVPFEMKDMISPSTSDYNDIALPNNISRFSKYLSLNTTYNDVVDTQVRMFYNETLVNQTGTNAHSLQMYYLDDSGVWRACSVQGANVEEGYVWANVTRLSSYVVVYAGPIHDLAIVNAEYQKSIIVENQVMPVNATVVNNGDYDEQLNVTCYLNETVLETRSLNLSSLESTSVLFDLNTTAIPKGRYVLTIQVSPVENETRLDDNTLSRMLTITIAGDVNGDFTVDIYDAILLSNAFNTYPSHPNWNANVDINGDSIVDIYDAILLSSHFNQHYP